MIEPLVGLALIIFGALLAYRTAARQWPVTHLTRADQDPADERHPDDVRASLGRGATRSDGLGRTTGGGA